MPPGDAQVRSVVLVADPDPTSHEVVRTTCGTCGLVAVTAHDAATALQLAEQRQPVAAICGLRLPLRSTLDLFGELRRCLPDAMIIAVADAHDPTLLDAGADTVLQRPLDAQVLAGLIEAATPTWSHDSSPLTEPRPRLLVIEHDPQLAATMQRWLAGRFQVVVVGSGWRALEEIKAHGPPDAILSELRLPDLEAADLCEALTAASPGLADRTLFMTGGFVADRAQTFLARIPGRWLHKPFNLSALRRMVAAVIPPRS
jgi:DNA-binding response OmpR family regulator